MLISHLRGSVEIFGAILLQQAQQARQQAEVSLNECKTKDTELRSLTNENSKLQQENQQLKLENLSASHRIDAMEADLDRLILTYSSTQHNFIAFLYMP